VAEVVGKVSEGAATTAVDLLSGGKIDLVVNTPRGRGPRADGDYIRSAAALHNVPCLTTVAAALAAAEGMADRARHPLVVRSLQEYQGRA
jgi:carbamoyl-phosphate synthase large subunit